MAVTRCRTRPGLRTMSNKAAADDRNPPTNPRSRLLPGSRPLRTEPSARVAPSGQLAWERDASALPSGACTPPGGPVGAQAEALARYDEFAKWFEQWTGDAAYLGSASYRVV
jgi:hypothetical protein